MLGELITAQRPRLTHLLMFLRGSDGGKERENNVCTSEREWERETVEEKEKGMRTIWMDEQEYRQECVQNNSKPMER